jgi:hypothetical protein
LRICGAIDLLIIIRSVTQQPLSVIFSQIHWCIINALGIKINKNKLASLTLANFVFRAHQCTMKDEW